MSPTPPPRLDSLWAAAQAAPLDPGPWANLFEACVRVSDEDGVNEVLEHLEAMDLGDSALWSRLAESLEGAALWALAGRAWRHVVTSQPTAPDAYRRLAGALSKAGELSMAMVTLEAAMRLAPDHAETHRMLARGLVARGQLTRARHHARRARSLEPEHPSMVALLEVVGPLEE